MTRMMCRYLFCAVVAVGVGGPAAGASWLNSVNDWLSRSGLPDQQQNNIRDQVRKIEDRRNKEKQKQQKADQKQSLQYLKDAYQKGKKAFDEKRYSAAYLHFLDVANSSMKGADKMAADAKGKVLEIEAMALTLLERAKICQLQNQHMQAAEYLQQVVGEFPYCDAAILARQRLQTLCAVPSVAASMRYAEGKAQHDAENYAVALDIYDEVMRRWPAELAALRAKVAASAITSDAEKMEMVREAKDIESDRVCPTLINLAKSFIMNYEMVRDSDSPDAHTMKDLKHRAQEKLEQVLTEYPESRYAEEARQLLGELQVASTRP
jgi:hypothetical protein